MALEAIAPSWRALAERVVAAYRAALGDDLVAVALFGSVAHGQAGPESNLDLYFDPLGRVRRTLPEGQEYQALVREGYRPDPRPIYHTVEHLRRHPWILLDIAPTTYSLANSKQYAGAVESSEQSVSSCRTETGTGA